MRTEIESKLETEKSFPVSKDRLYRAWVDTQDLKKWWRPLDGELERAEIDLNKGGKFRYEFILPENSIVITGEYLEIIPESKLIYTWNWHVPGGASGESSFKLTVSFEEKENGSSLNIIQENLKEEEQVYTHIEGWEKAMDALYNLLSGQSGSKEETAKSGYENEVSIPL